MSDPNQLFQQAGEACGRGDFAQGVALYRQLLADVPDHPQILSALGNAELAMGDIASGVTTLRRSLALFDRQPDAWCNLARGLRRQANFDEALTAIARSLALAPELFEGWMARGNIAWDLGRLEEALQAYQHAGRLRPSDPRVHFNSGNILYLLGRPDQAVGAYTVATRLDAAYVEAHLARARVLNELLHAPEALEAIDRALALRPADPEIIYTRGTILAALDRKEEAVAAFDEVLARDPGHADAWRWRGLVHQKMSRQDDAVADLTRALELRPDYPEAEFDRAYSLSELKRIEEAIAGYDRVVAARPDYDLAAFNRAVLHLMRGDFVAGWQGYERRWAHKVAAQQMVRDKPRWTGEGDLHGKTILVWAEQGYGDCLQFCRYVPMVAALGANVVLEAPARLVPLLVRLSGAGQVIASGTTRPDYDLQCPVMSLPAAFKTSLATIPADVPYLSADPAKVATFANGPSPRIGFLWEGNTAHDQDGRRSTALAGLEPLLRRPFAFHALQKDIRPDDIALLNHWNIPQHADEQNDFSDAAALIAAMDLVITVDTAIAHLAGALGKPVWLMLPYVAEWRWLTDRDDSPWYPNMRLFRQTARGDWGELVARVGAALDRHFAAM